MKHLAGTSGLTVLAEDQATPANGMVNYITSSYQTGYMNGDIKLATLSDTDDTDVTGSELLSNTSGTGAETLSISAGDTVVIQFSWSGRTAGYLQVLFDGNTIASPNDASGSLTLYRTSTSDNPSISFNAINGWNGTVDSRSVRLTEPDRSVNGNGLAVYGTITKTYVDEV